MNFLAMNKNNTDTLVNKYKIKKSKISMVQIYEYFFIKKKEYRFFYHRYSLVRAI